MTKINLVLSFLIFLFLTVPSVKAIAQESETPFGQSSQTTTDIVDKKDKKDKKKDKDKDKETVEIDENFFIYLLIDLVTFLLIVGLVYSRNCSTRDSIFTFLMFNLVIFMLTFVLNQIKMSIGAAFGLFAVFSMLRYRTQGITMKDMTYLFISIAVGLISAIQVEFRELLIINGVIFLFTFIFDSNLFFKTEHYKNVKYENIENIKPENYELLLKDMRERTGLNIHRIQIEEMNFLRDSADLIIFYYEKKK